MKKITIQISDETSEQLKYIQEALLLDRNRVMKLIIDKSYRTIKKSCDETEKAFKALDARENSQLHPQN